MLFYSPFIFYRFLLIIILLYHIVRNFSIWLKRIQRKDRNVSVCIKYSENWIKIWEIFSVFPGFYCAPIITLSSHLCFTFCIKNEIFLASYTFFLYFFFNKEFIDKIFSPFTESEITRRICYIEITRKRFILWEIFLASKVNDQCTKYSSILYRTKHDAIFSFLS